MVNNVTYTNIREIASRLMHHPLMVDLTLESIIQYTVDFIGRMGLPPIYYDKVETVEIKKMAHNDFSHIVTVAEQNELRNS